MEKDYLVLNPNHEVVASFDTEDEAASYLDEVGKNDPTVHAGDWSIDGPSEES